MDDPPFVKRDRPAAPAAVPAAARCARPMLAADHDTPTIAPPDLETKTRLKPARPRLYKVILINDDFTPRDFVVAVLKAVFRLTEDQSYRVMLTAHQRGVCVVAVYIKDVAETKAADATDAGRSAGFPLRFTTEPET